ncbi:MAG: MBL fold metallo-hydrolase [Proteobacteria bacterium]|nr:MBL fold metallo-hydrolase [Pseudomonadota bacterium]
MLFRQLFDPTTSTYTYLLADPDAREAILIDTVKEQSDRDVQVLEELGLRLVATLETHVHADHVTGAWLLRQRLGSDILYPSSSGVEGADRLVGEGDVITFGRHSVMVRLTPGHTDGCATYVTEDLTKAFTGDALLIRGSGRTDFQQGDSRRLYRSVHDQIFTLPEETELYPGHDYKGRLVSTVAEEKRFNPRLGDDQSEDDFVKTMANLGLSYPKQIDRALPANLNLGREEGDTNAPVAEDAWDQITRSPSGVRHVTPEWVAEHCGAFRMIDVRQPQEWFGPLGHIEKAELVPLGTLGQAAPTWDRDAPVVLICRSSGRSDQAARALENAGFTHVASMVGGMMAWNAADLAEACA